MNMPSFRLRKALALAPLALLAGALLARPAQASAFYGSVLAIVPGQAWSQSFSYSDSRFDSAWLGAIGVSAELDTPANKYFAPWLIEPVLFANDYTIVDWVIEPSEPLYHGVYLVLGTHLFTLWPIPINEYYNSSDFRFVN